jgi:hypothetical protein
MRTQIQKQAGMKTNLKVKEKGLEWTLPQEDPTLVAL